MRRSSKGLIQRRKLDRIMIYSTLLQAGFFTIGVPLFMLAELQGLDQDSKGKHRTHIKGERKYRHGGGFTTAEIFNKTPTKVPGFHHSRIDVEDTSVPEPRQTTI
ncbi:unnamed protein product [Clavelina lepadiformis]|uniref:Uncharacterized protein n=1 Tax=Clavelina lepadiformis TaxID=159417 RepID=A0ABP0F4Q9_CLALP